VTQTQPETRGDPLGHEARFCLCESYARVTERAALAGARWLGRAEQETAEADASTAMRLALDQLPIDGTVVIGTDGRLSTFATLARYFGCRKCKCERLPSVRWRAARST